jgi:hypothetical protein
VLFFVERNARWPNDECRGIAPMAVARDNLSGLFYDDVVIGGLRAVVRSFILTS